MITIKLTELSLPPDKVGNDLQEPRVEKCEAENDTTPIDNLTDHMTSFTGFPGISNPLLGTRRRTNSIPQSFASWNFM